MVRDNPTNVPVIQPINESVYLFPRTVLPIDVRRSPPRPAGYYGSDILAVTKQVHCSSFSHQIVN